MSALLVLRLVGFPLALFVSGLVAWRLARRSSDPRHDRPVWRDDSLADWYRERERLAEEERRRRHEALAQRATTEGRQADEGAVASREHRAGG